MRRMEGEAEMLIERIGEPAALELLAEECTELAHAALKLARAERGENPTPVKLEECQAAVLEEWADVIIAVGEVGELPWWNGRKVAQGCSYKYARMKSRLEQAGEEE